VLYTSFYFFFLIYDVDFQQLLDKDSFLIALNGVAKVFVGEMVEAGKEVMQDRDEDGPLKPHHLREAFRRYKRDGRFPGSEMASWNSFL